MDKQTFEALAKIVSDGKSKVASLVDMGDEQFAIRVHVFYGQGFGEDEINYSSKGEVKSPNRVIKLNGVDGLERFIVNFKAVGLNHAKFLDVVFSGGRDKDKKEIIKTHKKSEEIAEACNEFIADYFEIIMARTPSVKDDSKGVKEVKSENADLRKQLADLQNRMDAADSVTDAAANAKAELDAKTGEEEKSDEDKQLDDEIRKEELVKALLDGGTEDQLIDYIIKNVDKETTEPKLRKKKIDELKAMIVSAQE